MRPVNAYSALAVASAVTFALVLGTGTAGCVGLAALALSAHLWFWDPERDDIFNDDWIEIDQGMLLVALIPAGLLLLVIDRI